MKYIRNLQNNKYKGINLEFSDLTMPTCLQCFYKLSAKNWPSYMGLAMCIELATQKGWRRYAFLRFISFILRYLSQTVCQIFVWQVLGYKNAHYFSQHTVKSNGHNHCSRSGQICDVNFNPLTSFVRNH